MQTPEQKIVLQTVAIIGLGFLLYLFVSPAFKKKDDKVN
jgi:hypothetical protein